MTKPTGRPRGRPRKHPVAEMPEEVNPTATLEDEDGALKRRIAEVEQTLEGLDAPASPMATDLTQTTVEVLDKNERQRTTLQKLLRGLKVRRLEVERAKHERALAPHLAAREEAGGKLERLEAERLEVLEKIGRARAEWGDAHTRAESRAGHIRRIEAQIRELQA